MNNNSFEPFTESPEFSWPETLKEACGFGLTACFAYMVWAGLKYGAALAKAKVYKSMAKKSNTTATEGIGDGC